MRLSYRLGTEIVPTGLFKLCWGQAPVIDADYAFEFGDLMLVGAQQGTESSKESEEISQLHKALALRVHAAGRSTFSKFSKAALEKIAANKSGESVKMDCPMSPEDLLSLVDVLKGNLCTVRLDLEGCGLGTACLSFVLLSSV